MIFYSKECTSDASVLTLPESESRHCIKVLRKTIGDEIQIINGKGGHYTAKIIEDHHKKCVVEVISRTEHTAQNEIIHVAMAIPKNAERLEWFVEKATELGITKLTLLNCRHSERKKINETRLEKIVISAVKQSQRYFLPEIEGPVDFGQFVNKNQKGYIAHCYAGQKIQADAISACLPILIGPEGDFSKEEIDLATKTGYEPLELSKNRLRTETAALTGVFYLLSFLR